jgi:hypothetical protein
VSPRSSDSSTPPTPPAPPADRRPLAPGQKVRDASDDNIGVVLDHACQYAHPKAPPLFSYLIRWQDGQVQAVTEAAFHSGGGLELID